MLKTKGFVWLTDTSRLKTKSNKTLAEYKG